MLRPEAKGRQSLIYFEDIEVGHETSFGSYEVTREEVLDFARKYDPQPFHLSDEAAAKTHFGRLAASGRSLGGGTRQRDHDRGVRHVVPTIAVMMRLA